MLRNKTVGASLAVVVVSMLLGAADGSADDDHRNVDDDDDDVVDNDDGDDDDDEDDDDGGGGGDMGITSPTASTRFRLPRCSSTACAGSFSSSRSASTHRGASP
jgi:hypothetical protein